MNVLQTGPIIRGKDTQIKKGRSATRWGGISLAQGVEEGAWLLRERNSSLMRIDGNSKGGQLAHR